jgi:hypothetical protein
MNAIIVDRINNGFLFSLWTDLLLEKLRFNFIFHENLICHFRVDTYMQKVNLLTYLCGTTTNIWLSPVEEDLYMTVCLEHSASDL